MGNLVFCARVLPPSQPHSKVVVHYAIDAEDLDFEHGDDDRERASVDCVAQAYSSKGEFVKTSGVTNEVDLKSEALKTVLENGFSCAQELELSAGHYILKLAVRDNHTGAIGTANAKVIVPK
jgi:hypothetical protein